MKIRFTNNRGTSSIKKECPPSTAGVLYQQCQAKSMNSLPQNTVLSTRRGTSSMTISEYPKVEQNLPNWGFITTARGTARTLF